MAKSRVKFAILVVALTALFGSAVLSAGSVDAGRPGGGGKPSGGGASIRLNEADPHLGDWVTFTTSGGSGINVVCYEGGGLNMVYAAYQSVGTAFQLGGTNSEWLAMGGEVDCSAYLYGRKGVVATTWFHAAGAR